MPSNLIEAITFVIIISLGSFLYKKTSENYEITKKKLMFGWLIGFILLQIGINIEITILSIFGGLIFAVSGIMILGKNFKP